MVRRFCFIIGLVVCGLLAGIARAETYKLANGRELVGEVLPTSANDQGVQVKVGEGKYEQVSWESFSQDDLKRFAGNPRLEAFVEPFIEVTAQEKLKKTEVNISTCNHEHFFAYVGSPFQSLCHKSRLYSR